MESLRASPRWGNRMDPYNEGPDLELHNKGGAADYLKRRTKWLLSPARVVLVVVAAVLTLVLVSPRMFTGRMHLSKPTLSVSRLGASSEALLKIDSQKGQPSTSSGTTSSQGGFEDAKHDGIRPGQDSRQGLTYQLDEPVTPNREANFGEKVNIDSVLKPTTPEIPEPAGPALIRPNVPDYVKKPDLHFEEDTSDTFKESESLGVAANGEIVDTQGLEEDQKQATATESAALEQASSSNSPSLPNEVNLKVIPTQSPALEQEGPVQESNDVSGDPNEVQEQKPATGSADLEPESSLDLEDKDFRDYEVISEDESSSEQRWADIDGDPDF